MPNTKKDRPKVKKTVKTGTILRTFKRLNHRITNLSKIHYVAAISYVNGKFQVAGSPVLCEVLSKQDLLNVLERSINADIASKYLKFGVKKEEPKPQSEAQSEAQSEPQSSSEEANAVETVEAIMDNMTDN